MKVSSTHTVEIRVPIPTGVNVQVTDTRAVVVVAGSPTDVDDAIVRLKRFGQNIVREATIDQSPAVA